MANKLPPGVLPKLWRRKNRKSGDEFGNFYIYVENKPVNLRSAVYSVARERAREAFFQGKREFQDERFFEKPPAAPDTGSTSATGVPSAAGGLVGGGGDWTADVAGAASSAVSPDLHTSPDGRQTRLLTAAPGPSSSATDATDAPSSTSDESTASTEGPTDGAESTQIPPEMFADMTGNLAMVLVEAQIRGQEWMFERFAKVQAGPVPMNNLGRTAGIEFWKQQLAKWMPQDVPLPEWAAAMVVCAMFSIPAQVEGMQPLRKKEPASEAPQDATANLYPPA